MKTWRDLWTELRKLLSSILLRWGFEILPTSDDKLLLSKLMMQYLTRYDVNNPFGLQPYGWCPVQMQGVICGTEHYYFRSRGSSVSLVIADSEDKTLSFKHSDLKWSRAIDDYGQSGYDAGHIDHADAIRIATFWINEYLDIMMMKEPNNEVLEAFIRKSRNLPPK